MFHYKCFCLCVFPPQTPRRSWRMFWRSFTVKEFSPNTTQSRCVCVSISSDILSSHTHTHTHTHTHMQWRYRMLAKFLWFSVISITETLSHAAVFRWRRRWRLTRSLSFTSWRQQISSQLDCKPETLLYRPADFNSLLISCLYFQFPLSALPLFCVSNTSHTFHSEEAFGSPAN